MPTTKKGQPRQRRRSLTDLIAGVGQRRSLSSLMVSGDWEAFLTKLEDKAEKAAEEEETPARMVDWSDSDDDDDDDDDDEEEEDAEDEGSGRPGRRRGSSRFGAFGGGTDRSGSGSNLGSGGEKKTDRRGSGILGVGSIRRRGSGILSGGPIRRRGSGVDSEKPKRRGSGGVGEKGGGGGASSSNRSSVTSHDTAHTANTAHSEHSQAHGQQRRSQSANIRRTSTSFGRTNFIGQNFLLRTVSEHPQSVPLKVVERMSDLDPDAPSETDFCGNGALHVAADCGSSLQIVEELIRRCLAMAGTANHDGRTPLHLAAAPSCQDSDAASGERKGADLNVVATIFLASPLSVVRTDASGRTPPILARESGSPKEVCVFLAKRAVEFEDRMHRAEGELEGMVERDEIVLPPEGLTLGFLAEHVSRKGYGEWRRGRAAELYGLGGGAEEDGDGGDDDKEGG